MRIPLWATWPTTLVLAMGLYPRAGFAEPACGPYTLAFYEMGALYHRHGAGEPAGIDKEVVDALSRRSGCKFNTLVESRVRIWDQLAKNKLDLSVSGIATPERLQFADFFPYFQTRNYVLMRRQLAASLPTPEAFLADSQRRVAVVKSFKHGAVFDAWLSQLRDLHRVEELPDFESVLRVFKSGRVDAMLALPTSLARMQEMDNALEQFSVLDWAPKERIVHALVVSRQRVSVADRELLRTSLQAMQRDGTLDAIFKRHVGGTLAQAMRVDGP